MLQSFIVIEALLNVEECFEVLNKSPEFTCDSGLGLLSGFRSSKNVLIALEVLVPLGNGLTYFTYGLPSQYSFRKDVVMIGRKLLVTMLVLMSVIASENQSITRYRNLHSRQKRFVFFPGSVLQLAVGLAIPAGIKDKIIYTNYGIMINYDLPTNLSSLLPIAVIEEMRGSKSWDRLATDLFQRFGWVRSCWQKLEKWTDRNKKIEDSLMFELATIILREKETNELLKTDILRDTDPSMDACPLLRGIFNE